MQFAPLNDDNAYNNHIDDSSMRRKRSDELPRFVNDSEQSQFRWNRRYTYLLAGFLFICWFFYPSRSKSSADGETAVNWSNFAYSFYATDSATLCHAVLLADALVRLGSKADRVLFYPEYWDTAISDSKDRDSQLLVLARDKYNVKLHPIKLLTVGGRTKGTLRGLHTSRPTLQNCHSETITGPWLTPSQINGQGHGINPSPNLWRSRLSTTTALSP